ncbi:zinc ribbon domain-containing protein [Halorubrum sp. SP3]|uniref:zinc ribbon domain-containing protein n=1 Tax=Halorubrum sp. SP3 TaxID=1537265 RepID=UPI0010F52777|nr:zinc ribbon domain-containing protein [Halorubrum sp. SP3]TKX53038.1 zinc ribbon domain-containing protein [Halorubrum sp. SP3]
MKLSTRRTIRQWFLDAPRGAALALYAGAAGVTALGFFADASSVVLGGILTGVSLFYLRDEALPADACPNCNSRVDVMSQRYCSTCGERLDELEAAPPIDDRVDERFRPVGLEELERQANRDRQPKSVVADGGDQEYDEGER